MLIVPLVLIGPFIFVEKKASEPLIPMYLFRKRAFNLSVAGGFFANAIYFSCIIFVPLFMQNVRNADPVLAGMCVMPMTLSFVVMCILSGKIIARTGRYRVQNIIGFLIAFSGTLMLFCNELIVVKYTRLWHDDYSRCRSRSQCSDI